MARYKPGTKISLESIHRMQESEKKKEKAAAKAAKREASRLASEKRAPMMKDPANYHVIQNPGSYFELQVDNHTVETCTTIIDCHKRMNKLVEKAHGPVTQRLIDVKYDLKEQYFGFTPVKPKLDDTVKSTPIKLSGKKIYINKKDGIQEKDNSKRSR